MNYACNRILFPVTFFPDDILLYYYCSEIVLKTTLGIAVCWKMYLLYKLMIAKSLIYAKNRQAFCIQYYKEKAEIQRYVYQFLRLWYSTFKAWRGWIRMDNNTPNKQIISTLFDYIYFVYDAYLGYFQCTLGKREKNEIWIF